ncbi:MAG: asparagine synthase (glutamine-hydrolyzing) [Bacteroidales bacterium]
MCGIAGFNFNNEQLIRQMNLVQQHRGPDGEDIYIDEHVTLGHRRLAVVDLSENANQPMIYKHFVIVFNGEIYNFPEIKDELIQKNHSFSTNSDTEVILHAYEEWGYNCLEHFNGMWAFCIYDKEKNILFLARDRFGVKPLFYRISGSDFVFASEIKAITCYSNALTIDNKSLNQYFYQKYIGPGKTIFKEIEKLPESHYLVYDLAFNTTQKKRYYHLENEIEKARKIPLNVRKNNIYGLIHDAIEKRLIADVPVGSFLSGGIDSSLVSSVIASRHAHFDTFSIGFEEESFNELEYAKEVAQKTGVKHHYQTLTIDENFIFKTIQNIDEPFGDPSIIPTSLLSEITRKKVTVSLSGDAADELFGGYDTYKAALMAKLFPEFLLKPLKWLTSFIPASDKNLTAGFKIKKFFSDWDKNHQLRHLNWMSQTTDFQRKNLLGELFIPGNGLYESSIYEGLLGLQLNDFYNYLSNDILRKLDMASMACSLEARVPFLDYRLVPLVLSLPANLKIRGWVTKFFLKKMAERYLPPRIIRRKKYGFSAPVGIWIKQSARIQQFIINIEYYNHQLLDYEYIQTLFREHLQKKQDHSRILWLVFVFNFWYFSSKSSINNG